MRTYPRIRKTVKWGGAGLTVLILVAWGVSGRWEAGSMWSWGYVGVSCGRLIIAWADYQSLGPLPEWTFQRVPSEFPWKWLPKITQSSAQFILWLPFWMLLIPALAATAIAWRLDTLARRRARAGLCPKCRYDRAGLAPGAVCPECGAAPLAPKAEA